MTTGETNPQVNSFI